MRQRRAREVRRRDGHELVITPRKRAAQRRAVHRHRLALRRRADRAEPDDFSPTAFFVHPTGSATAPQPNFAHLFLPSNDHPRDKASFDIRFDVPAGQTAVANGVQLAQVDEPRAHALRLRPAPADGDRADPARRRPLRRHQRRLPLRRLPARRHRQAAHARSTCRCSTPRRRRSTGCRPRSAKYPFDLYGSLVVDADLGFALETQTLELIDTFWFHGLHGQGTWDPTLLHEMSHMWFGDSVAPVLVERPVAQRGPRQLVRVPLRRGERLPRGRHRGLPGRHRLRRPRRADEGRLRARRRVARRERARSRCRRARTRCSTSSATTAARSCSTRCARRSATPRSSASSAPTSTASGTARSRTDDFIALAAQVSGRRDVVPFLRDWVYGTKTPPMPGHPDWTVNDPATQRTLTTPNRRARK